MKTEELIGLIKIKKVFGNVPPAVAGIEMDSRKIEPGYVFVCVTGDTADGHDFVDEAIKRGASLIVAEKDVVADLTRTGLVLVKDSAKAMARLAHHFYGYPASRITTIGVTGTNGKTTVSHLVHEMLMQAGHISAIAGTLGFQLKDQLTPTPNTTSDVISNLAMLQTAVDHGCDTAIFEVSSHGLVHGRVWGIDFDIAIFTNLSPDHLDYHKTMEQYAQAKGLLFSQLGQDVRKTKFAVLNQDDPWALPFSQMTPFEVISYGLSAKADIYADHIEYFEDGTSFMLYSPQGSFPVKTAFIGKFNVYNVLAAAAALFAFGFEMEAIVKTIPFAQPVSGRMEKLRILSGPTVYIDYAHTPDAVEKAIHSVLPFKKGRLIVLIAGGNYREMPDRKHLAEKASIADDVIITINNPGTEAAETIMADLEIGMQHDRYIKIPDRKEAIQYAVKISAPEDIVIITNKGHETTLLIGEERMPHSDKEIALEALEKFHRQTKSPK